MGGEHESAKLHSGRISAEHDRRHVVLGTPRDGKLLVRDLDNNMDRALCI